MKLFSINCYYLTPPFQHCSTPTQSPFTDHMWLGCLCTDNPKQIKHALTRLGSLFLIVLQHSPLKTHIFRALVFFSQGGIGLIILV